MKNLTILVLVGIIVFMGYRIVHIENQRYALLLGMCDRKDGLQLPDFDCLSKVETRTHWAWHLWYALGDN